MGADASDNGTAKWAFVMCLIAQYLSTLLAVHAEGLDFLFLCPLPSPDLAARHGQSKGEP